MSKLKPCPFCGGEATVERIGHNGYYFVACSGLNCCDSCLAETEAEAIKAWNTRAERTCEVEVLPPNYLGDEFVFCSDCKHYYVGERNGANEWLCLRHQIADPGYGYCYWGERK